MLTAAWLSWKCSRNPDLWKNRPFACGEECTQAWESALCFSRYDVSIPLYTQSFYRSKYLHFKNHLSIECSLFVLVSICIHIIQQIFPTPISSFGSLRSLIESYESDPNSIPVFVLLHWQPKVKLSCCANFSTTSQKGSRNDSSSLSFFRQRSGGCKIVRSLPASHHRSLLWREEFRGMIKVVASFSVLVMFLCFVELVSIPFISFLRQNVNSANHEFACLANHFVGDRRESVVCTAAGNCGQY